MYQIGQGRSHTPAPADGSSFEIPLRAAVSKTTGAQLAAQQYDGKEGSPVIVTVNYIYVKTRNTSGACTIDVGIADTAVTSDTIFDGVSVAAAPSVYDSITDGGTNGLTRQLMTQGQYFTAFVASGDANGVEGYLEINIKPIVGGGP